MKNIIGAVSAKKHSIKPYHFKVLSGIRAIQETQEKKTDIEAQIAKEIQAVKDEPIEPESSKPVAQTDEQQNRFIEELLKKSDELSTNIVKLQMQIEKQEEDFKQRLINEVEKESAIAYDKGYQKAKDELEAELEEIKNRFLNSINTLEEEIKRGKEFLNQIESELSSTAIEIAKEVIAKEIKQSSSNIASILSKKLIEELKDAKNIRLKVNPSDYEALKEVYSNIENITVEGDSAITKGGVVVLSDIGNLDANISTRLERVKNLIENG